MGVTNQPRLNFVGVDITSVHVDIYNQYSNAEVKNTIVPHVFIPKDTPDTFKVIMDVHIQSENYFDIKAIVSGLFILNEDTEEEYRKIFMNQNAPAILFPYVRSFISTLTSSLGSSTGTIIIPPQVFKGEIDVINEDETSED